MMPDAGSAPSRIVFFGSTDFSLPALRALHSGPDEVVLAVAPPPAPAGRGRGLRPSPVAALAAELGLPLLETKSVRQDEMIEKISAAKPDFLVVAAYGGFLPPKLLNLCPHPPLNIHPSLLPRHRGAAPVSWSLIQGDAEVGVSIIFLEEAMDAGPILSQRAYPVPQGGNAPPQINGDSVIAAGNGFDSPLTAEGPESAGQWEARLAEAGAEDLLKVIEALKNGTAEPRPQNAALATVNPLLRKEDGRVDFNLPARRLAGLINGVDPWPGAQTVFQGKSLKLFNATAIPGKPQAEPGRVLGLDAGNRLLIACADGSIALAELQPEGKKRMPAPDFLRGYRPERIGAPPQTPPGGTAPCTPSETSPAG